MSFCLTKPEIKKIIEELPKTKDGLDKMINMSTKSRRAFFERTVSPEVAIQMNTAFEGKIILKNQQAGIMNWVEKISGKSPELKRDMRSRVENMTEILKPETEQVFLKDLVAKRLGVDVSPKQAANIVKLSQQIVKNKEAFEAGKLDRIDYGLSLRIFDKYMAKLKVEAGKKSAKETILDPAGLIIDAGGVSKSTLSAFDNSFFGRQGRRALASDPDLWAKNFLYSFKIIKDSFKKKKYSEVGVEIEPVDLVISDVITRPNAINGIYKKGKLDIPLTGEEAFPSSLPGKIWYLGRLFRASEQAYNASAIRMRADLADRYIKIAQDKGFDMNDPKVAKDVLDIANYMTGRGNLPLNESTAKFLNNMFFSPKKLKADFDFFRKPLPKVLGGNAKTKIGQQIARRNIIRDIGATGSFLYILHLVAPDVVELDPRSANFLQLRFGNTRVDISGGNRSLINLAARYVPTKHNGKWGRWMKSSTTGKWTFLSDTGFGKMTMLDVAEGFLEGKFSPLLGAIRDDAKGVTFNGEEATAYNLFTNNALPLPMQTYVELMENDNSNVLLYMLAEGSGFGVNVYGKK